MRRIIERVVTVVTTTTWKISWEADPPYAEPGAEPVSPALPGPEVVLTDTRPGPIVSEMKEVHSPEEENAPEQA